MQNRKGKMNQIGINRNVIVILLAIILLLCGAVAAKYIYDNDGKGIFAADEFYFTSNLLTEKGEKYTLGMDAESISFTLGNNADELRFADSPITYEVFVTASGLESDDPQPEIAFDDSAKTLEGGMLSVDSVTLKNLTVGGVYTVTAKGTAGYEKTLKATFTVSEQKTINKHVQKDPKGGAYVLLTVWTENLAGNVNISGTVKGLIPDGTDAVLEDIHNFVTGEYTTFNVTDDTNFVKPYSSKTYRFFLEDKEQTITADNFTVILDGYVANKATP